MRFRKFGAETRPTVQHNTIKKTKNISILYIRSKVPSSRKPDVITEIQCFILWLLPFTKSMMTEHVVSFGDFIKALE